MYAAIDAGSNTFRMLVATVEQGAVIPKYYLRRICRLAGKLSQNHGLDSDSMGRALSVFEEFSGFCQKSGIVKVQAVGTAAFRMAVNGQDFAEEVTHRTDIPLNIIDGITEARLTAAGVLTAIQPAPEYALIIDIGGGSTEFALVCEGKLAWTESLPLGVVRLSEELAGYERHAEIERIVVSVVGIISEHCHKLDIAMNQLALVGTAGTITTLAALDMRMEEYDWRRVNNYSLGLDSIARWHDLLTPLTPAEREALPGMEKGRGDLIVAGLEIILSVARSLDSKQLLVSDFGILEGLILSLNNDEYS